MKKQIQKIIALLFIVMGVSMQSKGQSGNFGSGYYQNQYFFNPAMAGLKPLELNVNMAYYKESTAISNGSNTFYATADYGLNKTVGLGFNLMVDQIGALSTTRIMGSYAYQLPLGGEKRKLNFGLSAGGVLNRFNVDELDGDLSDPSLYNFNDQKLQFDADFGVAYFRDALTLQVTVPNFVSSLRDNEKTILNQNTFFASAAYLFNLGEGNDGVQVEPKLAFRSFDKFKSILDAGANVSLLENVINVYAMYHSNQSVTGGIGFKALNSLRITGAYNSGARDSNSGTSLGSNFEFGLKYYTSRK